MSYNYTSIPGLAKTGIRSQKRKGLQSTVTWGSKASFVFGTFLALMLSLFSSLEGMAQTVLIDPANEVTLDQGSGPNDWISVQNTTNKWYVGTAAAVSGTGVYISNDLGVTNAYTTGIKQISHFYKDVALTGGLSESRIILSFKWKSGGSAQDNLIVYAVPTTSGITTANLPTGGIELTGGLNGNANGYKQGAFIVPPTLAGTTVRLVFSWSTTVSGAGLQPPASIDEISLISSMPKTITSAQTGNWNDPATWGGTIPTPYDDVVINTGHNVHISTANMGVSAYMVKHLQIKGTLDFNKTVAATSNFTVTGNVIIDNGGTLKLYDSNVAANNTPPNNVIANNSNSCAQSLTIQGDLTNNGSIDSTYGVANNRGLLFTGIGVQTISGTGSFGPNNIFNTLNFSGNASSAIPNIIWDVDGVVVANTLNIGTARVQVTTGKKLTLTSFASEKAFAGNFSGRGTLTVTTGAVTGGFISGSGFSRYITVSGTAIKENQDPATNAAGNKERFPFIAADGANRSLYVNRVTGTSTTQLAVVYTDNAATTAVTGISEVGYVVDTQLNSNWAIAVDGVSPTDNIYKIAVMGNGSFYPLTGNAKLMYVNGLTGTAEGGTPTPSVHRTDLTEAQLSSAPWYIGYSSADLSTYSLKTGNWNDPTVWSSSVVPTSNTSVTVVMGHTVTVPVSTTATAAVLSVGGTLTLGTSSTLNLGTPANKSKMNNVYGTLTVPATVTVNIFGGINTYGTGFQQTGGIINIDGNTGVAATSVPAGTSIATFASSAGLTAGNLNFPNPHFSSADTDYVVNVAAGTANKNHITTFGNQATPITANAYNFTGSLGTVWANMDPAGILKPANGSVINGDLIFQSECEVALPTGNIDILGNLTNVPGKLTSPGTITFKGSAAQTVTSLGNGIFRNNATTRTADFTNLIINSTVGVTFDFAPSMSGNLDLTKGKINMPAASVFEMINPASTVTAAANGSSYINGNFKKKVSGNTASNFVLCPVGDATKYLPIWLAPSTSTGLTVLVKPITNTGGTLDTPTLTTLAPNSWDVAISGGTYTDIRVKVSSVSVTANSVPVLAPTAAGVYTNAFGNTALYNSTAPASVLSSNTVSSATFSANNKVSFAQLEACTGTPAPGAVLINGTTDATANINLGDELTLSLQNATAGSSVTYAWQSSVDGVAYADITPAATTSQYVARPTVPTYYRCVVSCSALTAAATPINVTFTNDVATVQGASRCGIGTLVLGASTATVGANLGWYETAVGGAKKGSGDSFTTPKIDQGTYTYYVGTETTTSGNFTVVPTTNLKPLLTSAAGGGTADYYYFSTVNAVTLASIDIYPSVATVAHSFTVLLPGGSVLSVTGITFTQAQVDAANPSISPNPVAVRVPLNFAIPANTTDASLKFDQPVYYDNTTTAGVYTYPYVNNGFSFTGKVKSTAVAPDQGKMYSFNWKLASDNVVVSGPRKTVTATITAAPQVTVSLPSATMCGVSAALVTLTSSPANYTDYTWSPAGVTGTSATGWEFSPTMTTTYTLLATGGANGCQDETTFTVTSGPVAADQTICGRIYGEVELGAAMLGDATVFNLTPKPSAAIKWYADATSTQVLPNNFKLVSGHTYYVSQDLGDCESQRTPVMVTLNSPAAATGPTSQYVCHVATVADLSATGTNVIWEVSGAFLTSDDVIHFTNNKYTARQTIDGCPSPVGLEVAVFDVSLAPQGSANQTFGTKDGEVTVASLSATGSNVAWYSTQADALAGTNALSSTTVLVDQAKYYATQSVNGCRSTTALVVTVTLDPTLGVSSFDIAGLRLYPNPATDFVSVSNKSVISAVKVYNMLGQRVISVSPNKLETRIDMSSLPAGTYILEIQSEGGFAKTKLVKN